MSLRHLIYLSIKGVMKMNKNLISLEGGRTILNVKGQRLFLNMRDKEEEKIDLL